MPEVRKLTTIAFMDIAGYSAMMQTEEPRAIRSVKIFQKQVEDLVPSHKGKVIQIYGDGCLLAFDSALQAVGCILELQHGFIQQEIPVRAGLHLGEVLFSAQNAYGDGVNLASRIESAAVPGSILMSKSVRNQIKNQPEYELVALGAIPFKNIAEPIEVFAMGNEGLSVPSRKSVDKSKITKTTSRPLRWGLPLVILPLLALIGFAYFFQNGEEAKHNIHTIAVLPFSHQSPDEKDEFFTSGVYADVLVKLASVQDFRIISQSTVKNYKDYTGDMKELGERLNATYILEGAVRRWENQVRITTQLVESESNQVIWSHEYNSTLDDIFVLQAKIATEISGKLQANLSSSERSSIDEAPTTVLAAYDDYLKAVHILDQPRPTYEDIKEVISLLDRAVEADPGFGKAWARLIQAHSEQYDQLSRVEGREEEKTRTREKIKYALDMSKKIAPDGWEVLQEQAYYERKVNDDKLKAMQLFEKAVERNPSDVFSMYQLSLLYSQLGELGKSADILENAFQLTQNNGRISHYLTMAYEMLGRYGEMVPLLERLYKLYPEEKHYLVEAKYYQFLQDGSIESYGEFEKTIQTSKASSPWDERSIQNKEMVVAMFNREFDHYHSAWFGKYKSHTKSHGNWLCPMVANDHANQVRLLYANKREEEATQLLKELQQIVLRPVNLNSVCIFDAKVYLPKLDFMAGDSLGARRKLEEVAIDAINNPHFPLGPVERSVLVQAADLIAPDRVYYYYNKAVKETQSFISFESICADPWTYPNLIQHPEFVREIREDGRFVEFLSSYGFLKA